MKKTLPIEFMILDEKHDKIDLHIVVKKFGFFSSSFICIIQSVFSECSGLFIWPMLRNVFFRQTFHKSRAEIER